jgi:hypothetical protein
MTIVSNQGSLNLVDNKNGSVSLYWGEMVTPPAASYNVYMRSITYVANFQPTYTPNFGFGPSAQGYTPTYGVWALQGNVAGHSFTVSGLTECSYNPGTGIETPPGSYEFNVAAVVAGVEVAVSQYVHCTLQPLNIMLTTPMKRLFPFPNTGLN